MNWEYAYALPDYGPVPGTGYTTPEQIRYSGMKILKTQTPCCFETEIKKLAPDIDVETLKNAHIWYFAEFKAYEFDCLYFESIGTVAEVFVNGELSAKTSDVYLPLKVCGNIKDGRNTVVVHIFPDGDDARCFTGEDGQGLRGLLKPVTLRRKRKCEIKNAYIRTVAVDGENDTAKIRFTAETEVRPDCAHELSRLHYRVTVKDDKRRFQNEGEVFGSSIDCTLEITRPKLWWPRNYGKPNLYDASIEILDGTRQLDVFDTKLGIRTVSFSGSGPDAGILVNDRKVMLIGADIISCDLPVAKTEETVEQEIATCSEINLNLLRFKNGYPSETYFDCCDKNGILAWVELPGSSSSKELKTDFNILKKEALALTGYVRNHPSGVFFSAPSGDGDAQTLKNVIQKNNESAFFFVDGQSDPNICDYTGTGTAAELITELFGSIFEKQSSFDRQCQLAQAENAKTMIENVRLSGGEVPGVICARLIGEGRGEFPSIAASGLSRNISYHFLKRSLTPLCLYMTDKGEEGTELVAVNDMPYGDQITYVVKDLDDREKITLSGIVDIEAFSRTTLSTASLVSGHFYLITWTSRAGRAYSNHYLCPSFPVDYGKYTDALKKAGYYEFGAE